MSHNGHKQITDELIAATSVQFQAEGAGQIGTALNGFVLGGSQFFNPSGEELPPWWSPQRDIYLRRLVQGGRLLSGVIYQETARVKNMDWTLTNERDNKGSVKRWQQLLLGARYNLNKIGFRGFLQAIALDLLTQDNGAFIELIPEERTEGRLVQDKHYNLVITQPRTGRIGAIYAMDAAQCWRTYDPEYPVLYSNPWAIGQKPFLVLLHKSRVHTMAQFAQQNELGRGLGFCAVSRIFENFRLIRDMNTYRHEKLSGSGPELKFIQGVPGSMLEQVQGASVEMLQNRGFVKYGGSFLAGIPGDINAPPVSVTTVGIKDVPDGFDYEKELSLQVMQLAVAGGWDLREIGWPGVGVGQTRADAEVSDAKSAGKGRADVLKDIEEFINFALLPTHITFEFKQDNRLTERADAESARIRAETRSIQILSMELTVEEAREMAAQDGDIDPTFLDNQPTADNTTEASGVDNAPVQPQTEAVTEDETSLLKAVKGYSGADSFLLFARRWVRQALAGEIRPDEFTRLFNGLVNTFGQRAFLQGMQDGGAVGITLATMEPGERITMLTYISEQRMYVQGFAQSLFVNGASELAATNRLSLWVNKGLETLYNAGLLAGAGNANLEWRIGQTEKSCTDCLKLNGRVYRASTWAKYGIQPKSSELACKGFRCDCSLEKTNLPVTPGKPPALSGQKEHAHG